MKEYRKSFLKAIRQRLTIGWAILGILLITSGLLSIAGGTYTLMKKFTTSSTFYFKIHLYEKYTPKYKSTFYPWKVNIKAHLLKTGYTRTTIEVIRNWGDFDKDVITSCPQGFMINLDKGYKIERYESNLVHRVKADVPVPGHPGWRTTKVAQETPMELPMNLSVEDKLINMQGPTYIFRLAKLREITPPIDSLNEYFLHITFLFISNEPLDDYYRLTSGLVRVHILGGVGEYEFQGVGKKRSHNVTYPDLHLFESKREEQNIRTLFYWTPQVQGKFSVPEDMVGAKQFAEMAVNEEVIKGNFVYEISAAYWISFLGAILGLPMCAGGGYFIRKYFKRKHAVYRKILILSSNPKTTPRLRLDEEVREIEEGLRRSKHRGQFEIQSRLAVRLRDLRRALLDFEPQIVHFTGHGKKDGLLMEDDLGNAVGISANTLSALFELSSTQVECVILSACYSAPQAAAICKHINYVIGMRKEIKDKAAIEFAVGFYDALGAGKSVEQAFKFGCNAIRQIFPDLPEHLIPVLKKGPKV